MQLRIRNSIIGLLVSLFAVYVTYALADAGFSLYYPSERYSLINLATLISGVAAGYFFVLLVTIAKVKCRHGTENEVKMLSSLYRAVFIFAVLVMVVAARGQLDSFAAFFTLFGGLLLGRSLQAPVSGFAAWILVMVMRPFKLGDRIQFPNLALIGDASRFSPMYLTSNQGGGIPCDLRFRLGSSGADSSRCRDKSNETHY